MSESRIPQDLIRPEAYPHRPEKVELVETHISWVLLAGDLVYKVKKPADFGFLDFTTVEKRLHFCNEEVRLNRRLCPDVYLGVSEVTADGSGTLSVEGGGRVVDHAVRMKRLPVDKMMPQCLERGEVRLHTMDRLAEVLADFYQNAATGGDVDFYGGLESIRHNIDEDFWQTADVVGAALSGERFDWIQKYSDGFLDREAEFLARRVAGGFIREGHGDLHMGNICLGERVWIFDCIEFNAAFRCSDTASDLAFLAMDLDFHGRSDLGRRLIEQYVQLSGDRDLYLVLDFYKCYRAYVRGKINSFVYQSPDAPEEVRDQALRRARRYFDLAYRYAGGRRRPRVIAFFGLMGAGKTHLARATGRRLGAPVISSDAVRKKLAGLTGRTRVYVPFGEGIYSSDTTRRVYARMHETAENLAATGLDVILDASYAVDEYRREVIRLARAADAQAVFVLVRADEDVVRERLRRRETLGRSLSDGRREIVGDQARFFQAVGDLAPARLIVLDNDQDKEEAEAELFRQLGGEAEPGGEGTAG